MISTNTLSHKIVSKRLILSAAQVRKHPSTECQQTGKEASTSGIPLFPVSTKNLPGEQVF
jgi:hypothetical protein